MDSLKKENITIESSIKEFNELNNKVIDLKNKIENEINKINNLYEKTLNDLTKSFLIKHEKLIKKENELKEKLQNKVTKVKEQLENYLSISNNNIKMFEKIDKGIKKLEKEDINMIKNLSYVSKINKTKKEMKNIFQELMYGLNISYIEENNNIKYEDYCFNGISSPKDIEFKDISNSSVNIYWKIDNINLHNIDKSQIKFKVEIKKENENFEKIFEGNNTNCSINSLNKNTNYEFRICSFYKDLNSFWSPNHKIRTKDFDFDSIILIESERKKEFYNKIYEWTKYKGIELLYRGSRDGTLSKNFHEKCDNQGETVTLYKNEIGNIFGGYSSISWTSKSDSFNNAPGSFLFTLTNIYNIEPTQFQSNNDKREVRHSPNYGPSFGGGTDLGIYTDYFNRGAWTYFPNTYKDILGKGKSIFTGNSNNNIVEFKIKEIEVFKIFK